MMSLSHQSCSLPGLLRKKLEVGRWKRLNPTGAGQLPHFGVHQQVHWRKGLAHILYQLGIPNFGVLLACLLAAMNPKILVVVVVH